MKRWLCYYGHWKRGIWISPAISNLAFPPKPTLEFPLNMLTESLPPRRVEEATWPFFQSCLSGISAPVRELQAEDEELMVTKELDLPGWSSTFYTHDLHLQTTEPAMLRESGWGVLKQMFSFSPNHPIKVQRSEMDQICKLCYSTFSLLWQNPANWVTYKQEKLISQCSGGWDVCHQVANRFGEGGIFSP